MFTSHFGTDFFNSGAPVYTEELPVSDTTILETDDETVAMIKEILGMNCAHFIF